MKNAQKGFIVPLLIAIIAVLVIGGGIYYYSQNKSVTTDMSVSVDTQPTPTTQNNTASNPTKNNQVTTTPVQISQTDPLADIQVLSNVIPAGSYNVVKGGPSACQPEFFDPKVTKFQKAPTGGSPAELYKIAGSDESVGMMINGWSKEGENKISLASPFDLTVYEFGCASSFSFVADVTKNAVRQSLFTNIDNFLTQKSVSEDKTHIFLANNVKDTNGDWQLKKRIVNVENNTKTDLPNMSCVSDLGFWSGNKLLTYSDLNDPANSNSDKTKVCVWNTDGKLLSQVSAKLYWPAASAYYLGAQIGLLPKDSNIFYIYNSVASSQNACNVNLQDITNQSKNKKIKITDADSNGVCPSIKMDLSNVTFGSNTIPYQIVTQ